MLMSLNCLFGTETLPKHFLFVKRPIQTQFGRKGSSLPKTQKSSESTMGLVTYQCQPDRRQPKPKSTHFHYPTRSYVTLVAICTAISNFLDEGSM
jgi:hypothetical protein